MSGLYRFLRVVALASAIGVTSRRRGGFAFGVEPRDLVPGDFGQDAAAAQKFVAICEDPQLKVSLVSVGEDGAEEVREVTPEDITELAGSLEAYAEAEAATEALRVDAGNPPIDGLTPGGGDLKFENMKLTIPDGSDAEPEGTAVSEGEADEKAMDAQGTVAADPIGAEGGPEPTSEQARERAGDAAPDQKVAPTEEQKPEATVPPPVSGKSKTKTPKA